MKCIHEVENITITLLVKDLRQNIIKTVSLVEQPNEFAYAQHLGMVEWTSENNVILVNKKGNMVLAIDI